MKIHSLGLAVVFILLTACSSMIERPRTIGNGPIDDKPPPVVTRVSDINPKDQSYDYKVIIWPGLGKDFTMHPKMTLDEYNKTRQLDKYCAYQADSRPLSGVGEMIAKNAAAYLIYFPLAVGGAAKWAGSTASFERNAKIGAGSGVAGAAASGDLNFANVKRLDHSQCMYGMVSMAKERRELSRVWVNSVYGAAVELPEVTAVSPPQQMTRPPSRSRTPAPVTP